MPVQLIAAQDVYEYKSNEGVTEFTDQVKPDVKPVNQMQIKKMTPEEEAESKAKLDSIREKDKELDQRVKLQQQLENERRIRQQKEQELERLKNTQSDDSKNSNSNNNDNIWYNPPGYRPRPPIHRPPNRPGKPLRPRPTPLPIR